MSWETIRDLVRDEWLILSLLLLWSLVGLTIICERVYALWNAIPKAEAFKNRVVGAIEAGDLAKATALCETANEPLADVFERGLKTFRKRPTKVVETVNSQRIVVVNSFRRYLVVAGHGRVVRPVRRPLRHRRRHPQGLPVDVGRGCRRASRWSRRASPPRWWPPPPVCWSPSTPSSPTTTSSPG
jgi:hypothetical protein